LRRGRRRWCTTWEHSCRPSAATWCGSYEYLFRPKTFFQKFWKAPLPAKKQKLCNCVNIIDSNREYFKVFKNQQTYTIWQN
jgi:hypothetical protein